MVGLEQDPVDVLTSMQSKMALVGAMVAVCIATLATNIAANVVSPANDFAHVNPRLISFRTRWNDHCGFGRAHDAVEAAGNIGGVYLHHVQLIKHVPMFWDRVYTYAWFVTFAIAFVLYAALMKDRPAREER
jgi:cytosine/uracil/thiamine/allantoin permease